jgi:hypothetical protein
MLDIDEKLVDEIASSAEFDQVLDEVCAANPRFKQIPRIQQRTALALLMSGKLDSIEEIEKIYVKRPLPSIQEFLTPEYLGDTANEIYDHWRKDLYEIFAQESVIRQFALTGAIGTGKSTAAICAELFNLFRVNCLRRPQLSMGSDPTKSMTLQLFTVTKGKAKSLLYERVKTFLEVCQYYVQVQHESDFLDFRDEKNEHIIPWIEVNSVDDHHILFPNKIRIAFGSQARHALGEDVFGGILDEAEFRIGGDVDSTIKLYYEILERIRSRFLGSRFTLMCIVSSISTERGVMAQYIEDARRRPDTKVSQYSIWEVKYPNAIKEHGYFYVLRGTQRHPSRVMTDEEKVRIEKGLLEPPAASQFIQVPEIYRHDFETRPEASLMNLAGQVSLSQEIPFDDLSEVEDPSLMPVIEISAPLQGERPLREQLPKEYFIQTPQGWRIRRYPGAPRVAHLDLADSGEAGITVLHKELSITGKIMYVTDLVIKVTSPNRISLDSVREFMFDLKDYYGMSFAIVTADQYQSVQTLQRFEVTNFASVRVGRLSVDTNRIPYDALSALVAEGTLKIGKLGDLRKQLESIYFGDKGKPYSTGRKDIADSLCGAAFNAISNPADVPVNFYENHEEITNRIRKVFEKYEEVA